MHGWDSGQKWRPGSGRWKLFKQKKQTYELWKKEHKKRFFQPNFGWKNGDWSFIDSGLSDAEARATEPVIAS